MSASRNHARTVILKGHETVVADLCIDKAGDDIVLAAPSFAPKADNLAAEEHHTAKVIILLWDVRANLH